MAAQATLTALHAGIPRILVFGREVPTDPSMPAPWSTPDAAYSVERAYSEQHDQPPFLGNRALREGVAGGRGGNGGQRLPDRVAKTRRHAATRPQRGSAMTIWRLNWRVSRISSFTDKGGLMPATHSPMPARAG